MVPETTCGTGVCDGVGDAVGVRVVHGEAVRVDEGDRDNCATAHASASASARDRAQRRILAARQPCTADAKFGVEKKALRWILRPPSTRVLISTPMEHRKAEPFAIMKPSRSGLPRPHSSQRGHLRTRLGDSLAKIVFGRERAFAGHVANVLGFTPSCAFPPVKGSRTAVAAARRQQRPQCSRRRSRAAPEGASESHLETERR